MQYSRLADCYAELESTQSTLEKADILADLFADAEPDELEVLATLVMGRAFPAWDDAEVGVASKLMIKALARATGVSEAEINDLWAQKGDLGDVAEEIVGKKKQQTLATKEVTPRLVRENLKAMAEMEGSSSQDRKIAKIGELIGFATPMEAKYIVRTILGAMRVGVGEGTVRDGIIGAFFADIVDKKDFTRYLERDGLSVAIAEDIAEDATGYGLFDTFESKNEVTLCAESELTPERLWSADGFDLVVVADPVAVKTRIQRLVQHAYDVTTDFGRVAQITAADGPSGLRELDIELFRPVKVMLAQKAESLEDGLETVGNDDGIAALEYKYDGMRVQIHKSGDEVRVFTRRLEEVTTQFPDIVAAVKKQVTADDCIIEGEAVAYDPDDRSFVAFQELSKRIKRKYDIQQVTAQIPVVTFLFDIIRLDGESVLKDTQAERWAALGSIIDEAAYELELAAHIETADIEEANAFYQQALTDGQEGVMVKSLTARYKPGSRVGYMMKVKPVMETLDLVIVEAEWGEGRRSQWLGSYTLACRDGDGDFLTVGKMATGFTDEQLDAMTERLRDHIISEDGRDVVVEPEVVVEVAYEEIQRSPTYDSGYALRFPRLVGVREDMGPEDANDMEKVGSLYTDQ